MLRINKRIKIVVTIVFVAIIFWGFYGIDITICRNSLNPDLQCKFTHLVESIKFSFYLLNLFGIPLLFLAGLVIAFLVIYILRRLRRQS